MALLPVQNAIHPLSCVAIDFQDRVALLLVQNTIHSLSCVVINAQDPDLNGVAADIHMREQMQATIEFAVRLLAFYIMITTARTSPIIDAAFSAQLYSKTHQDNVDYLKSRKIGVGTIIYVLHALSSWAGVYEEGSMTMDMVGRSFQCRINELKLFVLIIGQDNDKDHYDTTAAPYAYNKPDAAADGGIDSDAEEEPCLCIMPVPGVDLDQHKACNQALLKDIVDGGLLANNTGKTSSRILPW